MKHSSFYLLILLLTVVISKSAINQNSTIELTFSATNDGQHVLLDSVHVENLTQGSDTTLYAPDSVLKLYHTGINDPVLVNNAVAVSQNYPNPFIDFTSIKIDLPQKDQIEISIYGISGKKLQHYEKTHLAGQHVFTFYPGNEKSYLFTVNVNQATKTIQMLNASSNYTTGKQSSLVYSHYMDQKTDWKSKNTNQGFLFCAGNQLRYTAYAKTIHAVIGSDVKQNTPEQNLLIPLQITEGIPCEETPILNLEGEMYKTVIIGEQCWMKENLNIGFRLDVNVLTSNNGVIEKYCYDDLLINCEIYGALYHWKEMMLHTTAPGIQGICPNGWHLPTDDEWWELINYIGGEDIAGGKLKARGTAYWDPPNEGATNESGFTVFAGGGRYHHGYYQTFGTYGGFWSSTEYGFSDAYYFQLKSNESAISTGLNIKGNCHSVRCVKD